MALPRRLITQTHGVKIIVGCKASELGLEAGPAVQVSDGYAHDYPFFKGLVDRTGDTGFKMKEVSADKGYLWRRQHAGDFAPWRNPVYSI